MSTFDLVMKRVGRPLQLRLRRAFSTIVDRWLGVVTTDETVAERFGHADADFRLISRSFGWTSCWRLLRRVPSSTTDVFLDIGCGAGRVTAAAARRGYARVIGIEIAAEFADLAKANLASLRQPHSPAAIVLGDATSFEVPTDVTVVFLYNPFQGTALDATLEQIIASHDRAPRRIVIAYANPVEHQRILARHRLRTAGWLQLAWRPTAEWRRMLAVQLLEVVPQSSRGGGAQAVETP